MSVRSSEVVVVGAGPAGLTAAAGLRRSGRRVVLIDDGRSAARSIDRADNYPGCVGAMNGEALLQALTAQLDAAHGAVTDRRVVRIERIDGGFEIPAERHRLRFHWLVLATGCADALPAIPGLQGVRYRHRMWHRSMGDASMLAGQRIAVVGGALAGEDAAHLARAGAIVTLFDAEAPRAHFQDVQVQRRAQPILKLHAPSEGQVVARLADGSIERFDRLCVSCARVPRVELARSLGVALAPDGHVQVSDSCATSVPGVYAVGDVASPCGQLAIAVGHGAIAAEAINRSLGVAAAPWRSAA